MPFTDKIVEQINATLLTEIFSKGNFSGSKLFGLGYPELVTENETVKPIVYGLNEEDFTYDDIYPVCLYHRQLATPVSQSPQDSFGDEDSQKETANMTMIVWANRDKIKIHESTLASWIGSVIGINFAPSLFADLSLSKVTVSPVNYNFDSNGIFQQEYRQNKPFGIENEYFSIQYKIESSYTKSCFATCCN